MDRKLEHDARGRVDERQPHLAPAIGPACDAADQRRAVAREAVKVERVDRLRVRQRMQPLALEVALEVDVLLDQQRAPAQLERKRRAASAVTETERHGPLGWREAEAIAAHEPIDLGGVQATLAPRVLALAHPENHRHEGELEREPHAAIRVATLVRRSARRGRERRAHESAEPLQHGNNRRPHANVQRRTRYRASEAHRHSSEGGQGRNQARNEGTKEEGSDTGTYVG